MVQKTVQQLPSTSDFTLWYIHQWYEKLKLDGLYLDFFYAGSAKNKEAGLGSTRDGEFRGVVSYFATREMYKRIYTMLKKINPECIIIGNTPSNVDTPIWSFSDITLHGEGEWRVGGGGILKDSYLDNIRLDEFRAKFMGHQFGVIPWFLPEYHYATIKLEQWVSVAPPTRSPTEEISQRLFGIGLLHDFSLALRGDINPAATRKLYNVLDEFGREDYEAAEFFGYWKNSDLISGQSDVIKASAYRKPKGGALIVVLNTTRQAQNATLF